MTDLFDTGAPFTTVAAHRSAISSAHAPVDGAPVSEHAAVAAVVQAIRTQRPPAPRYGADLWELAPVLTLIESWGSNDTMALDLLARKLAFLLACADQNRASDSARIAFSSVTVTAAGATFLVMGPKEQTAARPNRRDSVDRIADPARCPARCMAAYIARTADARAQAGNAAADRLFLTTVPPFHAATAQTIANWNLRTMAEAGVDTTRFKAHSIRAVATTTAIRAGASKAQAADGKWASIATMDRHYNRAPAAPARGAAPRRGMTAKILRQAPMTTRSASAAGASAPPS